jgi:nitroreductase
LSPTNDFWEVLSTSRSIRRFTDEPVDDETLDRCLEATDVVTEWCQRAALALHFA